MGGVSLALKRWNREPWFYRDRVFRGHVLDIGGAGDYFGNVLPHFPNVTSCQMVDLEAPRDEGHVRVDLHDWTPEPDSADCVLSSHTLEHLRDPYQRVSQWAAAVRRGGYLVVIVPSWYTYEREQWPPHVNGGHLTTWCLDWERGPRPDHQRSLVACFPDGLRLIRATTLDEGFNPADRGDQTAAGTCECGLEAVWQRVA